MQLIRLNIRNTTKVVLAFVWKVGPSDWPKFFHHCGWAPGSQDIERQMEYKSRQSVPEMSASIAATIGTSSEPSSFEVKVTRKLWKKHWKLFSGMISVSLSCLDMSWYLLVLPVSGEAEIQLNRWRFAWLVFNLVAQMELLFRDITVTSYTHVQSLWNVVYPLRSFWNGRPLLELVERTLQTLGQAPPSFLPARMWSKHVQANWLSGELFACYSVELEKQ